MTSRARTLCGLVIVLGLLAVVLLLVKPVRASFEDDLILRLRAFDRPVGSLPTEVDCGSAFAAIRGSNEPASLYTIARDAACHDEGYRRLIAALAAGCIVLVMGFLLILGSRFADGGSGGGGSGAARRERRYQATQARWAQARSPDAATEPETGAQVDTDEGPDAEPGDDAPTLTPADEAR